MFSKLINKTCNQNKLQAFVNDLIQSIPRLSETHHKPLVENMSRTIQSTSTVADILLGILAMMIVLLNTIEIVLILRCKRKKTFDKLLLSLAISDLMVGFAVATFKIVDVTTYNTIPWLVGENFAGIFKFSINFSITNLFMITADRLLAVRFPIKHRILLTERRVNAMIAVIWLVSFVTSALFFLLQFKWKKERLSLLITSGILLLLGATMLAVYINIFYWISKRKVNGTVVNGQDGVAVKRGLAMVIKGPYVTERAVFITGCIVTISFIICTYPLAFDYLLYQSVARISTPSRFMILSNSLLNPFIYFFKSYLTPKRRKVAGEVMEMK